MTPEELKLIQDDILSLKQSIEMIAQMITGVDAKLDTGQERQGERDETLSLIANQLIRLGEALPRIGDELADLARELRSSLGSPKKKTRLGRV